MATAPEPSVSAANSRMTSFEVVPGSLRRAMVFSCTTRESSPSTTRAYSTTPASIMAPASSMPLTKPRQALVTSKFWHDVGSPSPWCTETAVDGSR